MLKIEAVFVAAIVFIQSVQCTTREILRTQSQRFTSTTIAGAVPSIIYMHVRSYVAHGGLEEE